MCPPRLKAREETGEPWLSYRRRSCWEEGLPTDPAKPKVKRSMGEAGRRVFSQTSGRWVCRSEEAKNASVASRSDEDLSEAQGVAAAHPEGCYSLFLKLGGTLSDMS